MLNWSIQVVGSKTRYEYQLNLLYTAWSNSYCSFSSNKYKNVAVLWFFNTLTDLLTTKLKYLNENQWIGINSSINLSSSSRCSISSDLTTIAEADSSWRANSSYEGKVLVPKSEAACVLVLWRFIDCVCLRLVTAQTSSRARGWLSVVSELTLRLSEGISAACRPAVAFRSSRNRFGCIQQARVWFLSLDQQQQHDLCRLQWNFGLIWRETPLLPCY